MSINYVDRRNDEEIIDIMRSILSQGTMEVETFNEAVLVKLMDLRGTPVLGYDSVRNIEQDFLHWKEGI